MRFVSLLLSVAFLAASSAAVGDNNASEYDKVSMVLMPSEEATTAPLISQTTAPSSKKPFTAMNTMKKEMKIETLPIEMPATVEHSLQAVESKPLAVTGFITRNGSIYEIEDKNGFGKIQSRQALEDGQHICNYGAVVIYSNVPCEQLTNIKVRTVKEKPALDQVPASVIKHDNQSNEEEEKNDLEEEEEEDNFETRQKRPNKNNQKRPNNNAQKRPNKRPQKRPNQNTQKRPTKRPQKRPNQNTQKRPNKRPQKRPNQNTQKRPTKRPEKRPNKNGQKQPNKNGQKLPNTDVEKQPINTANNNFRRWEEETYDDYEEVYDDYEPYYQIRRRQKVEPYSSVYEYY